MNNSEFIKFGNNEEHTIKLSFDEPFTKDGQYGKSHLYSGTKGSKDVKFYASAGLHEEIQHQGHKKGSRIEIKKIIKPGEDYSIFTVNGVNTKHNFGSGTQPKVETSASSSSTSSNDFDFLKNKMTELEQRIKKLETDSVPF